MQQGGFLTIGVLKLEVYKRSAAFLAEDQQDEQYGPNQSQ